MNDLPRHYTAGRPERFGDGLRLTIMRILSPLLALQLATCFAQTSPTITLGNGIRLKVTVKTGNNDPDPLKPEMQPAAQNSVYRILRDESSLAVWAYEVVVDRLQDGVHFQIVVKPAGEEFAAKFPNADGGKPVPTMPRPIESGTLAAGAGFTIEIPTNPGLFQHRTDTVQVEPDPRSDGGAAPRVRTVPQIRFNGLRIAINGTLLPASGPGTLVSGPYAMFYLPKRGGYFFSIQPVSSKPFAQIGVVDHNQLKFVVDNDEYVCASITPILTRGDSGQVWVYHDPLFKPPGSGTGSDAKADEFYTAASDSLSWWLP
jgi:hypothetical protein